jgi:hypothetical protein
MEAQYLAAMNAIFDLTFAGPDETTQQLRDRLEQIRACARYRAAVDLGRPVDSPLHSTGGVSDSGRQ